MFFSVVRTEQSTITFKKQIIILVAESVTYNFLFHIHEELDTLPLSVFLSTPVQTIDTGTDSCQ
jgi:hypothetical protein